MLFEELFTKNDVYWMKADEGAESDIVISSRIRLARNLKKVPFPHLLNPETGAKCLEKIRGAWSSWDKDKAIDFAMATLNEIQPIDRQILVEKHLISPNLGNQDADFQGIIINEKGSISIMINEEDHLRTQCLLPGLNISECYEIANQYDDEMEKWLDYAFDLRRGYLTACPTNVGTGMRASVMLHLPAIVMSGQIQPIFQNLGQLGMTVRGLYGEGTEARGNFFQLSNQVTMGQNEKEIINNLALITAQIIEQERLTRTKLLKDMPHQLEDNVGRAYGILTNAAVMTSKEALVLLSNLRLGIDMGIISSVLPGTVNELMVAIRPAHLQKKAGIEMDPLKRDVYRAKVIKEQLQQNR